MLHDKAKTTSQGCKKMHFHATTFSKSTANKNKQIPRGKKTILSVKKEMNQNTNMMLSRQILWNPGTGADREGPHTPPWDPQMSCKQGQLDWRSSSLRAAREDSRCPGKRESQVNNEICPEYCMEYSFPKNDPLLIWYSNFTDVLKCTKSCLDQQEKSGWPIDGLRLLYILF